MLTLRITDADGNELFNEIIPDPRDHKHVALRQVIMDAYQCASDWYMERWRRDVTLELKDASLFKAPTIN